MSYPFLSVRKKRDLLGRLASFAYGIGTDFSLYRVTRSYPADEYIDQALPLLDPRTRPGPWVTYLQSHERRIRELKPFHPEVYIAVRLDLAERPTVGAGVLGAWDRTVRRHRPSVKVTRRQLDRLREAEDRTHGRTGPLPGARRATSRELQWLLRRAPVRGVTEPLMDENWRPAMSVDPEGAYTPLGYTLERHANAPVLEHDRHLTVDGDEATSPSGDARPRRPPRDRGVPGRHRTVCSRRWTR